MALTCQAIDTSPSRPQASSRFLSGQGEFLLLAFGERVTLPFRFFSQTD
jgi:hypothetical protein